MADLKAEIESLERAVARNLAMPKSRQKRRWQERQIAKFKSSGLSNIPMHPDHPALWLLSLLKGLKLLGGDEWKS